MHPLIDALVILGLLAVGLVAVAPSEAPAAAAIVVPSIAWYAAVTPLLVRSDVESRRLPNGATLPGVVVVALSMAGAAIAGPSGPDPRHSVFTLVGVAIGGTVLSRHGGLGMGDVKLASGLAASVALVAPDALAPFGMLVGLAGLVGAVVERRRSATCGPASIAYGPALLVGYWGALAFDALSRVGAVPP